jgi:vacuolar-type H+-ATPase subunit E/Vma4
MSDSESKLQQELLGDAQRQAERAMSRARSAAAKALAAAQEEHAKLRTLRLAETAQEAETQAHAIAARLRYETQRRWLTLREAALDRLFAAVLPRLEAGDGIDRERSLRQLLQEALEAIGPGAAEVRLNPEAARLLSAETIAAVCAQAWPQSRPVPGVTRVIDDAQRAGVLVVSADGRRVFDNTYATRLERLRGRLRALASVGAASAESDDGSHA